MRPARLVPVLYLLPFAVALAASLPEAWRSWPWWRAIDAPAAGLVQVELPLGVVGRGHGEQDDLRVIDERGSEVAWVGDRRPARKRPEWRRVPLIDTGFVPGSHSVVVLDMGEDGALHNRVRVDTSREDFFAWVEIAASDDRRDWRVIRERTPLLRLADGTEERTLDFPETRSRWLKLTILDAAAPLVPDSCSVAHDVEVAPDLVFWDPVAKRVDDPSAAESESVYEIDFDLPAVPVSVARFETGARDFRRPVALSVWSASGDRWQSLGRGDIYRYETAAPSDRPVAERLRLDATEGRGARFRVTVSDGNDPPLSDLRITLGAERRRIAFRAEAGRSYRLLYGNDRAQAPRYDLAATTPEEAIRSAAPAKLGPETRNEGWVSPEPWTERNPWVLWIALVAVVAVLGRLALRALRA